MNPTEIAITAASLVVLLAMIFMAQPIWLSLAVSGAVSLLRNAIELLEGVGHGVADIARDLQMTPRHVRRLAGIEGPRPRLSLVR